MPAAEMESTPARTRRPARPDPLTRVPDRAFVRIDDPEEEEMMTDLPRAKGESWMVQHLREVRLYSYIVIKTTKFAMLTRVVILLLKKPDIFLLFI